MKVSLIAFTQKGAQTCRRIMTLRAGEGDLCAGFQKGSFSEDGELYSVKEPLRQWTGRAFQTEDAIVFIGAVGIAVRAIAPYLKSKTTDPAVLAVDEQGKFVIPLVSGHIGGANRLALKIAQGLGSTAVVTTATDLNDRFAVDQWAKENELFISDMKLAKQVSADLLQDKMVGFASPFKINGNLPKGLTYKASGLNIELSAARLPSRDNTLLLIPKSMILGIGCRKNISLEKIEILVDEILERENISPRAIACAASIDLKQNEPGLLEFCKKRSLPFYVYSAEELRAVKGEFTESAFVHSVTGVDNVCERAALLAGGSANLMVKKQAKDGVTLAIAVKSLAYTF